MESLENRKISEGIDCFPRKLESKCGKITGVFRLNRSQKLVSFGDFFLSERGGENSKDFRSMIIFGFPACSSSGFN